MFASSIVARLTRHSATSFVSTNTLMEISALTARHVDDLYAKYQALDDYEKIVLKLLSVVYKPIGISKFNALLTTIGRNSDLFEGAKVKGLSIDKRNYLIKSGFVLQHKEGLQLNALLMNQLVNECVADKNYLALVVEVDREIPCLRGYPWQHHILGIQWAVRHSYLMADYDEMEKLLDCDKNPQIINARFNAILVQLFFVPFDLPTFLKLPNNIQYQSFAAWVALQNQLGNNNSYPITLLERVCEHNPSNALLLQLLAECYLYSGRFEDFKHVINRDDTSCYGLQLNATHQFLIGDFDAAKVLFEKAIVAKNKLARRKNQYLGATLGLFHKLCLLVGASQKNAEYYDRVIDLVQFEINDRKKVGSDYECVITALGKLALSLSSGGPYVLNVSHYEHSLRQSAFYYHQMLLLSGLAAVWCQERLHPSKIKQLNSARQYFIKTEMLLFAYICEQVIHVLEPSSKGNVKVRAIPRVVLFPDLICRKPEWDLALEKLIALSPDSVNANAAVDKQADKPVRMVWEMLFNANAVSFKPREQKKTAKGWSKGRPVSLQRLAKDYESLVYLTEADQAMCEAIDAYQSWGYYTSVEYVLEGTKALNAAKNLDNLYLIDQLESPIDLIQKEPELVVSQQGDELLLSIADLPASLDDDEVFTIKEHNSQSYSFTVFSASHLKVAKIVGEGGLVIPMHAKAKVLESVSAIAPLLNIQSDIQELDTGLETVACDEYLVINIQPLAEGLDFTCMVMPFGDAGPAFKPIVGNASLTTEINGKRIATQRDLLREQTLLDALDEHCPHFLAMPDNNLALEDLQEALEALEQLEKVVNTKPMPFALRLRWPKGKKINLSKTLDSNHLALSINKKSEWFDLNGALSVNESDVIELRKLLELVSAASGRFVQLNNDQVLVLSQDLRKKLDLLNQATDGGKFHQLASVQVAEAATGMRMKTNHAWEAQTLKMHESNSIAPVVPSTLQAELRDYQIAGFDWMSRLAHWGAGACLADDMGLGKTLQALAVLLSRAKNGPGLVIAPTSVCFNWQQEMAKFSPTLNVKLFADYTSTEQREHLLDNVAGFDCVIVSYGLLQRESQRLAKVQWHTIVADEAQALKNPLAKRTQAACALKGDFKIITTGTPIENNLTELWSLFRFITPGLLGNVKRFGQRYALPIENVKEDKLAARKASLGLKALIQPFILRRMKSQVLTELPARTEINIHVELSAKEKTFYEALRRNAVENIANATKVANEGEQRIKMLAELIKLRQACCHPKLVMPDSKLSSAKLAALDELLDELQKNNHKALIFSQFVGHLQLIKKHLDSRAIVYQYLDGSTPQKQRAERVNAFQHGEGDVFLISLKAGGSGLNLTAADYVIHMDPWWNPAVEEQASDRAHRMGQKRPVTIYRLVTKDTIEDRIVALHQHKRDLADNLLAGNEQAQRLSVDDMLNLLKETF